jgi:hypothetical protein
MNPATGKGTQSPQIKYEHCLCHLATGDMLRSAVAAKSPMGLEAKKAMESGALVSDDIVVGLIEEATKKPGGYRALGCVPLIPSVSVRRLHLLCVCVHVHLHVRARARVCVLVV